jgi:hypothetical protein
VELAAVGLQTEPDRGHADVDAGDDSARFVADRTLQHEPRERRIGEAHAEELLEPGRGHLTLERDSVEQPEQGASAGLAWAMEALRSGPEQLKIDVPSSDVRERPLDATAITDDRADVGESPSERRARDPVDHGGVARIEGRDMVDNRIRMLVTERTGDAGLDDGHTRVAKPVETM